MLSPKLRTEIYDRTVLKGTWKADYDRENQTLDLNFEIIPEQSAGGNTINGWDKGNGAEYKIDIRF